MNDGKQRIDDREDRKPITLGYALLVVMMVGIAIMEMFVIYLVVRNVFFD